MKLTENAKEKFGVIGEWASIVGPIFALFLYIHHENVALTNRLDNHIYEINKRTDDLHKEYYDLLKEMRK